MHLPFVLLGLLSASSINGATSLPVANNGQTPRCDNTPVNNCNCQCTINQDSRAIRALEAKMEGLIEMTNNASGNRDSIGSLEAKVENLITLNNSTPSGTGAAAKSLERKIESVVELNNNTSSAMKSLESKVQSLVGLINKTSGVSDSMKALEVKVDSLIALNKKPSNVSDVMKSLEAKVESLIALNNKTSGVIDAMKSLESNVQSLIALNNKTSGFSDAMKSLNEKVDSLIALINNTFSPIPQLVPNPAVTSAASVVSSCKEQYEKDNLSKSQVYNLSIDAQLIPVYCHMGDFGCGAGGWTLALKTDGVKRTFRFSSPLWSDRNTYNIAGGMTSFDNQETKLPTYWSTNFSKICLGMKIGGQTRFVTLNQTATSLHALISDGAFRASDLGRERWKMLIGPQGSLQQNCNREGFNAFCSGTSNPSKARIGILGNNNNDCVSCDSRIGFGMKGEPDSSIRCGVAARNYADNGEKYVNAFGYILVQ